MRPHQWVKNLFVFAPLLFGRKLTDPQAIANSAIAFAVFCLLASALYIFNDWIDVEEDRNHPEKRHRPLSSGALTIRKALFAATLLAAAAISLSVLLGLGFVAIAGLYMILTLSYCLVTKNIPVLDAMTVSAGFVIRVVGGAVAIGVLASHWLIACAFLLAMFLSFSKRRQELMILSTDAGDHRKVLRDYSVEFLGQVNTILIAASIVCYALYTVAPETVDRFRTDSLIYGTAFVIYGMFRYMMLIDDPKYGGNPSKMLVSDKPLLLTVIGWGIYNAAVVYHSDLIDLLIPLLSIPS